MANPKSPTSGLLKPMIGKDALHIKCQRCGESGHTVKECPLYLQGNRMTETFRYMHEDPMHDYFEQRKIRNKEDRIKELQDILNESTSSDSDSDSSSDECKRKKRKHKSHKDHKRKRKKEKESKDSGSSHKKKRKIKRLSKKSIKSKHKRKKQTP